MKRRNLFRLLAGAVGASAVEVTGLKPVAAPKVEINPEYFTAEFEEVYIWLNPPSDTPTPTMPLVRHNFVEGKWVEVPYCKITSDQDKDQASA
jgi:hypothetical protein